MRKTTRKFVAVAAGVTSIALLGDGLLRRQRRQRHPDERRDQQGDDTTPITLTVATFNNFGYTDELLAEYTEEHPNVTVKQTVAAKSEDARTNLTTKLAAGGAGLADIEAIEVDWLPELVQSRDTFARPRRRRRRGSLARAGRSKPATTARRHAHRLRHRHRPRGRSATARTCSRPPACRRPRQRSPSSSVARTPRGTSTSRSAAVQAASGRRVVRLGRRDLPGHGQPARGRLRGHRRHADPARRQHGRQGPLRHGHRCRRPRSSRRTSTQWSGDWDAAFQNDGFATMLCPAWMTGPIEERAGGVTGWDVADVFPGGGGNWGGSYLTVPAAGQERRGGQGARRVADRARDRRSRRSSTRAPSRARSRRSTTRR